MSVSGGALYIGISDRSNLDCDRNKWILIERLFFHFSDENIARAICYLFQ